jgi:hypothetical protein
MIMKKILIAAAFATFSAGVFAQSPVASPDSVRDPIQQGDPALKSMPEQTGYTRDMVKIKPAQLPAAVQNALAATTYKGWEQAHIYRNKNSSEYLIEFQDPLKTRLYRFDKKGKEIKDQ